MAEGEQISMPTFEHFEDEESFGQRQARIIQLLSFEGEKDLRKSAIESLKEKPKFSDLSDPTSKDALIEWNRRKEDLLERLEPEDRILGEIHLELERARLHFDAGNKDEAFENFDSARYKALEEYRKNIGNKNMLNLYRYIMNTMGKKFPDGINE